MDRSKDIERRPPLVTLKVPETAMEVVRQIAAAEERTQVVVIERALRAYLKLHPKALTGEVA